MPMTAQEIVDRIVAEVGCDVPADTVDTFKAGDPQAEVTGVATTFLATCDVLRRAADARLDFVITHEPLFYHHREDTREIEGDAVLAGKRALIAERGLTVWRFHDGWHARRPDGIVEGMVEALGWQAYQDAAEPRVFDLPAASVGELAAAAKARLGAAAVRIVGDAEMRTGRAALSVGAPASISQIRLLQRSDVEVLVAGETREWETVEYVRDAADTGLRKALILLGHCSSEEAGMRHMARWLAQRLPDLRIEFLPAGDPCRPA